MDIKIISLIRQAFEHLELELKKNINVNRQTFSYFPEMMVSAFIFSYVQQ